MRIEKIIFCLLLLSFMKITAQRWELQNSGIKTAIRNVSFLDTLNGWAAIDNGNYLHTSDGGRNWIIEKINSENHGLRNIQFISNNYGYACGALGGLFSTKDGGKTWTTYANNFEIDFLDLTFVNENEGWAVGERYELNFGRGMIVHTSDGGASWEKQLELESTNPFTVRFFKSIRMKNTKEGWAIAGNYFDNFSPTYVYKTTDGGKNWTVLPTPIQSPARRIRIAGEDTLWADGYGLAPMSITNNGGLNWEQSSTIKNFINAISPQTGNTGWASTVDFIGGLPAKILFTTNQGAAWRNELSVNEIITDMENKGGYVWIVGTNGLIMKRSPLSTSIKENPVTLPLLKIYQNYPNPFNSQTTISYFLQSVSDVRIEIYDMLGRVVLTSNFLNQIEGKKEFEWSARDGFGNQVSSGLYICKFSVKVQNGKSFVQLLKLIFLK